jgi:predicted AAA+ superfamily ATPase
MNFIKDKMREVYLNGIYQRILEGKSVLVVGQYGCGKTVLLSQILPRNKKIVKIESLASVHMLLPDILRQLDRNVKFNPMQSVKYLQMVREYDICIIIDELNDLNPKVYPYIKRFMDSGISVIAAGLDEPDIVQMLRSRCEDVLSRFKVIYLKPLSKEAIKGSLKNWEPEAVDMLYGAVGGNLRIFFDVSDECLRKANEMKSEKITAAVVSQFV